jgi:hypothetical protein
VDLLETFCGFGKEGDDLGVEIVGHGRAPLR